MTDLFRLKFDSDEVFDIETQGREKTEGVEPFRRKNPNTGKIWFIACCGYECRGPIQLVNIHPKRGSKIKPHGRHLNPEQIQQLRKVDPGFKEAFPHFDPKAYFHCIKRINYESNQKRPRNDSLGDLIKTLVASHIQELRELAAQIFDINITDKFFLRFFEAYIKNEGWQYGSVDNYPITFFTIARAVNLWGFKCKEGSQLEKFLNDDKAKELGLFITPYHQIKTQDPLKPNDPCAPTVRIDVKHHNSYNIVYAKRKNEQDVKQVILHTRTLNWEMDSPRKWKIASKHTPELEVILSDLKNKVHQERLIR